MKKIFLALFLVALMLLVFISCADKNQDVGDDSPDTSDTSEISDPATYLVKYIASDGGYIRGNFSQSVNPGEKTSGVKAVAMDGYRFAGWSDGLQTAARKEENVSADAEYTAFFVKVHTVFFSCDQTYGSLEGELSQTVTDGKACSSVKALPKLGYRFVCWSNGAVESELEHVPSTSETLYAMFAVDSMELPVISIVTENGSPIDSKDDYVKCTVSMSGSQVGDPVSEEAGKIKIRGNSTASMPKKPYKLKFDQKIDLFGNGSAKTWTLIANYLDYSMIRNYLAYSIANEFDDLKYTTTVQYVDVYVNGSYDGVYMVCEQVEVGRHRVDIDESYDTANTGYLLEMDERAPNEGTEDRDYFSIGEGESEKHYAIKSPDTEDEAFTQEHVNFIKSYVQDCIEALDSGDFEQVKQYIDVNSFADNYILGELFHSVDIGFSSFYMYKDVDGKLFCGPAWDYDLSLGNCSYNEQAVDVEYLYAKSENIWFAKLLQFDEFVALVTEKLHGYVPIIEQTVDGCMEYVRSCSNAFERNFVRWDLLGNAENEGHGYVPENIYKIETWEAQLNFVTAWLEASLENLKVCYPTQ